MATLLDKVRAPFIHAAQKHGLHEGLGLASPEKSEEYADQIINLMTNVELLEAISEAIREYEP